MLYELADALVVYTLAAIILTVMISTLFSLLAKLVREIKWNLEARRIAKYGRDKKP